jgi:hypothetical protein
MGRKFKRGLGKLSTMGRKFKRGLGELSTMGRKPKQTVSFTFSHEIK